MKINPPQTLKQIANRISCRYVGDDDFIVSGLNKIHKVEHGDLMFVDHPKYYDKALESNATTILINKEVDCPAGKALIISDDPFRDYNLLTKEFKPLTQWQGDIGADLIIGEGSILRPNVTIGNRVKIGENCLIHSGVVIHDDTEIGDNVIIHSNTVLGGDAFYYKKRESGYDKMHTCGCVIIEDDVEIGTLCTIDRGVSGDTRIGKGTKIDNHVQVGHDTVIGKNCLFASQVGISGCVIVEDDVTLWGQVGVPSGLTIGKGAVVLGQSGIMSSVEGGKSYLGSPAREAREKMREIAMIRKLPKILEKLK